MTLSALHNYETALQDFYSVTMLTNPKQNRPHIFTGNRRAGQTLMGIVGDRRLILMPDGGRFSRHASVLEIRSTTDAYYDRIVYKTTGT